MQMLTLGPVIEGVISLNKKLFNQNELQIDVDIQDDLQVYGNRDQLEQVFMNLMLNAHAAMESGGCLQIRAFKEKSNVVIIFADQGVGISPDAINQIFDPFYSTKPNGTGLGLFVSFGIIQNHHGSINVQSEEHVGTTFRGTCWNHLHNRVAYLQVIFHIITYPTGIHCDSKLCWSISLFT